MENSNFDNSSIRINNNKFLTENNPTSNKENLYKENKISNFAHKTINTYNESNKKIIELDRNIEVLTNTFNDNFNYNNDKNKLKVESENLKNEIDEFEKFILEINNFMIQKGEHKESQSFAKNLIHNHFTYINQNGSIIQSNKSTTVKQLTKASSNNTIGIIHNGNIFFHHKRKDQLFAQYPNGQVLVTGANGQKCSLKIQFLNDHQYSLLTVCVKLAVQIYKKELENEQKHHQAKHHRHLQAPLNTSLKIEEEQQRKEDQLKQQHVVVSKGLDKLVHLNTILAAEKKIREKSAKKEEERAKEARHRKEKIDDQKYDLNQTEIKATDINKSKSAQSEDTSHQLNQKRAEILRPNFSIIEEEPDPPPKAAPAA